MSMIWKISRALATAMICILTLILLTAPALADKDDDDEQELTGYDIRVLLKGSATVDHYTATVEEGVYYIVSSDDPEDELAELEEGDDFTLYASGSDYSYSGGGENGGGNKPFMVIPEDEDCLFSLGGVEYRGGLKVMSNKEYCYAINVIDVELYLYGVVGRELGYNYHLEATKAQAVAARSYALASVSEDNKYYDVTATTASQVYGGYDAESAHIRKAVDKTYGQVIMYEDQPVMAYFCSNAGGHTEDVDNIWVSNKIPLKGVESPYDAYSPQYSTYGASCWSWTVEYTPQQLVDLANAYGKTDIGKYKSIEYSTKLDGKESASGRAMSVTVTGSKGKVTATKDSIRSLLDLKSNLITISDNTNDPAAAYVMGADGLKTAWTKLTDLFAINGSLVKTRANGDAKSFFVISADGVTELKKEAGSYDKIVISGRGYGHGVGMSQWGAIAMADDGYDWDEIIEHYYCHNGIEIEELY